jgi:uncharacterized radical SAM protein YgiQ
MDSMINHYTANRKLRNDDAYSPNGRHGLRPDRATLAYCQRARQAFKHVPVIAGGVEASLRRFAHYDYWSDKLRRSIIMDAKADLLVYGMGEAPLLEILWRLDHGAGIRHCRDIRGVVFRLGQSEARAHDSGGCVRLPSYEEVQRSKSEFAKMTRVIHAESNPFNARGLTQGYGDELVVANPPSLPHDEREMDRVYGLPYTRQPHPAYAGQPIPAFTVIRHSIQIMRGCFGGCTFCSITTHEGRVIQSRSQASILSEIRRLGRDPAFTGVVSDLGGPTANMYRMNCDSESVRAKCRRLSCVHPTICKRLNVDHGPLRQLLAAARSEPGIRRVMIASGVRTDLARRDPAYLQDLAAHHTGGLLKVAPEHADPEVLRLMKKPPIDDFDTFRQQFATASAACGKTQHLVPYFIAGHPGSDLSAMVKVAQFLKRTGMRPDKVQDFIPSPMDVATCMYYTGIDPSTGREVYVARGAKERRQQRALLQFFKPENHQRVKEALLATGRRDLIGSGKRCLIPHQPPRLSPSARSTLDAAELGGSNNTAPAQPGYRSGRSTAGRVPRRGRHEPER